MLHHYNEGIAAIQIDRDRVALHTQYGGATLAITTVPHLIDLTVDAEHLVVLSKDGEVQLFHINKGGIALRSQFVANDAVAVALYRDSIFVAKGTRLEVLELDGTHRLSVPYPDATITHLSVNSDFLVVATSQREIHLLDVTTGEPQEVASPICLEEYGGSLDQVGCNADGTWVSVTVAADDGKQSSPSMYLCKFASCDLSGSTDLSERVVKATLPSDLTGSTVRSHCWDPAEANVLVCEHTGGAAVLFVTEQGQFLEADQVAKKDLPGKLLGIDFPRLYSAEIEYGDDTNFTTSSTHHNSRDAKTCDIVLSTTVLKSFRGMEDEGPSTLSALVQFAYFTALGDLEKAYISIQLVKRPEVWERLCKLGIRQKKLSLVERCLPNIRNGEKVIKAARQRSTDDGEKFGGEKIAALAAIALELGATEEAEQLLGQCSRYDLLSDLLRSQNRWDEALLVVQEHGDEALLVETHYKYAEYLENTVGEEGLAVDHYILSGRVKEFLERLVESGRLTDAENVVVKSKETELFSWLAQKHEQANNMSSAMELYQLAGDDLGLARMALRQNDVDTATAIAENGDATVVRHVALHLEGVGEAQRAISLFARGGMLDDAMRLAKRYGLYTEIVEVALDIGDSEQIGKCANWLEECGQLARAAQLYVKDGNKSKALGLCLRMDDDNIDGAGVGQELKQLFSSIIDDIDDVTALTDAEVSTYARRFITWDLGESAFDFLVKSRGQYTTFFSSFASLCSDRGDHRLASKMYAKAGDKISSLKCLVRLKDTTTIIAFAKAARVDEAYEIAASYLQSLPEWTQDEQHVGTILSFLAKANNYSKLIQVHEEMARACIDEGEDYERALDLLTQGASYVEKIDDIHERATLRRQLQRKLYSVTKFVRAKKKLNLTTEPMELFCAEAAREDETNSIVRVEHGIKALVLRYVSLHRYQDSYDLIQAMDYPSRYISRDVMEQVWTACDQDPREVAEIIADDENRNSDRQF